jgi:Lon protease-like protein
MRADEMPLFPLRLVLFPGAELRLRIFETRYLDMVRLCTREQRPFGVCLLPEDANGDAPARPAAIGTAAHIVDFYTLPDGMLGIRCEGKQRFHVERTKVRDNGLIVGEVRLLQDDAEDSVRPEHALLVQLLERILEQVGGPHAKAERACFDRAHWVSCRLAELLPFSLLAQQRLLACPDAHARLQAVVEGLPALQDEDGE